jgi:hypothetical protein
MAFKAEASRTVTVPADIHKAASGVAHVMDRFVSPGRWTKVDDGYEFWCFGNERNGSSGRIRLIEDSGGSATQLTVTLEHHQEKGGRIEGMGMHLGLAHTLKRITRGVVGVALSEPCGRHELQV